MSGSLRGRIALGVATVVLLGLGVRSFAQTLLWKDDVTLLTHVVAENPRSYAGHNTIARVYSLEGDYERALAHYKKALAIEPANPISINNVGETLDRMGAHQHAVAYYELVFTNHTPAHNNVPVFAMMHTNYAVALFGLQRTDDALRELDVALRLDPTSAEAAYTKGAILFNLGRVQEAIPWLERAARGAPFNALFRKNLDAARAAVGNR